VCGERGVVDLVEQISEQSFVAWDAGSSFSFVLDLEKES
jgi:hypothetical protein